MLSDGKMILTAEEVTNVLILVLMEYALWPEYEYGEEKRVQMS